MEGIFLEFENENALRSYPFSAECVPAADEELRIASDVFVDAALYPINPEGRLYLSGVSDKGLFSISDDTGVIMTGEPSGSIVEFYDLSGLDRHVGTLVASSKEMLEEFAGRGVAREYGVENTAFASSCVFPVVIDGVVSLSVAESSKVAGVTGFSNGPNDDIRVSSKELDDGRRTLRFDVLPRPGIKNDASIRRIICVVDGQTPFRISKTHYNIVMVKLGLGVNKEVVCSAAHRETERQIAEKALTLVKNENNAFPIEMKTGETTLILFADSCASRAGAGELARELLEEKQALPEGAEILVMKNTRDNEADCIEAACRADHVILVHRVYAAACLDPETGDGFSSGTFDRLIDAVHEKGKTVIVVSCQLPYDAARFPAADAVLLTWWGSAMPTLPPKGSTWSANLPEGLLACFGQGSADGRLPVNIPTLDEQYRTTDQILYPRSA